MDCYFRYSVPRALIARAFPLHNRDAALTLSQPLDTTNPHLPKADLEVYSSSIIGEP